jgi:hypothetical protein
MAGKVKTGKNYRSLRSRFNEIDGRHEGTRTPDLYRVNFDLNNLKPFACLAFPLSLPRKNGLKRPSFGDELVTSFSNQTRVQKRRCRQV